MSDLNPVEPVVDPSKLGLVVYSYWQRWQGQYSSLKAPPFQSALDVLDHIQAFGLGSLQIMVEGWDPEFARSVRSTSEGYGIALEGIIELPHHEADVSRFDRELRTAREADVRICRAAIGGRRYELFREASEFEAFLESAQKSMELAEPVARRHGVRLGIENHKDFESEELADVLGRMASEHIGSCIDTGNALSLLEEPLHCVEALAPYVVTVHLKDMAVKDHDLGFQMAEVPLGTGICDVEEMIRVIRSKNSGVVFHLEMITRDPLEIPCLTDGYWQTFGHRSGIDLARILRLVREKGASELPSIAGKSKEAILAQEEQAVLDSIEFAKTSLGFSGI